MRRAIAHRALGRLDMPPPHEQHGADAQRQQRPKPCGVLNPDERSPVEEDVSQRAAAERGKPRNDAHAHRIEALARCFNEAREREGESGNRFDDQLRVRQGPDRCGLHALIIGIGPPAAAVLSFRSIKPVSYTHLTLPTIYSV